jgi:hypothetical protein
MNDGWVAKVRAWCDPVFDAADCGFAWNGQNDALLWEAEPARFAAKYPDAGIKDSYGGDISGVHCIDFWVYLDSPGFARVSVEGWNLPELHVALRGWPDTDGRSLAALFGRILHQPVPEIAPD